ncbi:MAG: class I SAM-dependent rRNA methyltransferase, partial [Bacteroidota bacterium]
MSVPYPEVILKSGKDQSLKRFHPWVFSGAIAKLPDGLQEGDLVVVKNSAAKIMGIGHFQIGSIQVRMLSFKEEAVSRDFWYRRLSAALAHRRAMGLLDHPDHDMYRLVHGEGDALPGLIIDIYGALAVVQCHSIGFFHVRSTIAELLMELLPSLRAVYDKSAHSLPFKAPIETNDTYLIGEPQAWTAQEYGNTYQIGVEEGQKTGFFIDQRENRALLQSMAKGREVLNTFSYTGGFSVAALRGGAKLVHSVDSSQKAIALAEQNVAINFSDPVPHQAMVADVFKFIKKIKDRYDLIVLDPPAFAKHRRVLPQALKGYRSINQQAFEQIRQGGILFTFSCSQVVSKDDFRRAVFTGAAIARREVKIIHQLSQPPDHPISIY